MITPCVHLNGTSASALCDQLNEVYLALETAAEKLREAAPNGRDYYPLGPDALTAAVEQHRRRMGVIRGLQDELSQSIEAIQAQT